MTLIQIVNSVLRRLREDSVTDLSSEYGRLIAEFVVETHQEIALIHDWANGYKEVIFDCVASQSEYDLTDTVSGSGGVVAGGNVTNPNSEPAARFGAYIYLDDTATAPLDTMPLIAPDAFRYYRNMELSATGQPRYVDLRMNEDMSGYAAELYPAPDAEYRILLPMWIPEPELVTDGTDDNTQIKLPTRPIQLGALLLALNERGEEIGEPGNLAERRYYDSIAAAIEADTKARQLTNRYDWYRD